MSESDRERAVTEFLAAEGRPRRELFKKLMQQYGAELTDTDIERMAVAIRDPSPKLSARMTSLLARREKRDLFEQQLRGLKPGKIEILRRQFERIAADAS